MVLTPRTLDDLVGPAEWLRFYKLTHHDGAPPVLRYLPTPGADHAAQAADLSDVLAERIGSGVTVEAVPHIESERSGKLFGCVHTGARVGAHA